MDNSSRIGLRYKKELVPGNSIFQIESRVNLTDGGDVLSSRDSYAGWRGTRAARIRLGRTIGPVYYATYDYISMHNHDTGTSSDALLAGTVVGNQGFMNNTIWYTSPKFGGITIDFAFSLLGESRVDPSMDQPRHIGLVASYDAGPLHLAVSYANTENDADLAPGAGIQASSATAWTFGGAYDFKFMVLGALWEVAERDVLGGSVDTRLLAHRGHVPVRPARAPPELRLGGRGRRAPAPSSGRSATTTTSPSRPRCTRSTRRSTTTATATS